MEFSGGGVVVGVSRVVVWGSVATGVVDTWLSWLVRRTVDDFWVAG